MSGVVNLKAEREKRDPHIEGAAKCLDCGHKSHGVQMGEAG